VCGISRVRLLLLRFVERLEKGKFLLREEEVVNSVALVVDDLFLNLNENGGLLIKLNKLLCD
jgi:hypothetical protein